MRKLIALILASTLALSAFSNVHRLTPEQVERVTRQCEDGTHVVTKAYSSKLIADFAAVPIGILTVASNSYSGYVLVLFVSASVPYAAAVQARSNCKALDIT